MKSGNLLLGLVACAALCACTDNDIVENSSPQVFTGDKAYMVIKISDVGADNALTKATFSTGTQAERAVDKDNVCFYFYDSDGLYVTKSTGWKDLDDSSSNDEDKNLLAGYKLVELNDLTNTNYPSYVVTIINQPDNFTAPSTLKDMETKMASESEVGIYESATATTKYFTMSTSSYKDSGRSDGFYFASLVSSDDFYEGTDEIGNQSAGEYAVEIYVERLAAKVGLDTNIEENKKEGDDIPWENFVKGDDTKSPFISQGEHTMSRADIGIVGGSDGIASKDETYYMITEDIYDGVDDDGNLTSKEYELYIHLDGWALNATAKKSYMMKNINTSWTDTYPGFTWNDASNYRSYWGMSYNYDDVNCKYPASSSDITEGTESGYCLNYISANDINNDVDGSAIEYCAENTNTASNSGDTTNKILTSKNPSAITSVLLKATAYNGESGYALTIVKCANDLYTLDCYLKYALQHVSYSTPLYVSDDSGSTIQQATTSDFSLDNNGGDGKVKVVPASDDAQFYSDESGTEEITDIQTILDEHFNDTYGTDATCYNNGLMYYNIPIEHLAEASGDDIVEGQYGVVRNHYYMITVTGLDNLGTGIVDPEEPIVPTPESTTYYLSAQVNILSWKLVEQSVSL